MIHNIEEWEDIRVYDLMVEASKHVQRCRVGSFNNVAWVNIADACTAYRTLEEVRTVIGEIVAKPYVHAARKRIYKKWLAGTERYVR